MKRSTFTAARIVDQQAFAAVTPSLWAGLCGVPTAPHLGNVLTTVTDRKHRTTVGTYLTYQLTATDYYPFGMAMPGRDELSAEYRYGFNGKENDREWGTTFTQDYGFRVYNPAMGSF